MTNFNNQNENKNHSKRRRRKCCNSIIHNGGNDDNKMRMSIPMSMPSSTSTSTSTLTSMSLSMKTCSLFLLILVLHQSNQTQNQVQAFVQHQHQHGRFSVISSHQKSIRNSNSNTNNSNKRRHHHHHHHHHPSFTKLLDSPADDFMTTSSSSDTDSDTTDSSSSSSSYNSTYLDSPTAPEVNTWTKIMTNPDPFSNPPSSNDPTLDSSINGINGANGVNGNSNNNGVNANGKGNDNTSMSNSDTYLSTLDTSSSSSNNNNSISSSSSSPNTLSAAASSTASSSSDTTDTQGLNLDISNQNPDDTQQIETYWDKLMPHVSYLGTTNSKQIKEALRVAYTSHKHQKRKSGEPFIIHPIEVAILLTSLSMDAETIMAGLLHDTVEDTELTFSQIEIMFGHTVKSIVEGETKVSKLPRLEFNNYADEQAENLRQMFVAMTDDYRIIIVKLADRLHNMRTLQHMKPEKQQKISKETLDIFAPLAHRMGIWQFKSELEDISFQYLYPKEYRKITRMLRKHATKLNETLDYSRDKLDRALRENQVLQEQAVSVKVVGRTKELYSLYYKMQTMGEEELDHIKDVVGLRVIIEPKKPKERSIGSSSGSETVSVNGSSATVSLSGSGSTANGLKEGGSDIDDDLDNNETDWGVWLCYHVLGVVQHLPGFQPVPTKVKDYISFPKPNGYQSLHTALMLNGQTIEVQIRTSAMHKIAEFGMASHWAYTDGKRRQQHRNAQGEPLGDLYNTPWLSSIKEWQDEVLCSRDFVDCVRRELLGKRVFVFLRNGKILNLTKGSTVIDAAFQIHTEVGLTMYAVEINGKPVPFSYELKNGDVVSVLTGDGKPATDWMRFAKIRSTRSKLRSYFRRKQRQSLRDVGAILLMDFLNMYGEVISTSSFLEEPFDVPVAVEDMSSFLPGKSNYQDVDDLLIDIGGSHDRNFLRMAIAKIFLVPQKTLANAEKNRSQALSNRMLDVVNAKRQSALDVGAALDEEEDAFDAEFDIPIEDTNKAEKTNGALVNGTNGSPTSQMKVQTTTNELETPTTFGATIFNGSSKIADPKHVCPSCLPVMGDEIIGSRPCGMDSNDFATTVHRPECEIVLKAKNEDKAQQTEVQSESPESYFPNSSNLRKNGRRIKSSFKTRLKRHFSGLNQNSNTESPSQSNTEDQEFNKSKSLELVDLVWDESYAGGEKFLFLTELSLICNDRKLLLADCSEVVSDMSEIVKTGSLSTKDNAILNFLVKVESIDHLQKLMNSLREIPSVISVERTFGSNL